MIPMESMQHVGARHRVFGLIFMVSNWLETVGDRFLEGITVKQWYLLLMLETFFQAPPTLSELAEVSGTSRQNIKVIAQKLESRGFLEIKRDQSDKRVLRITATDAAKQFFAARAEQDTEFLDRLFQDVKENTLQGMETGLLELLGQLEQMKGDFS